MKTRRDVFYQETCPPCRVLSRLAVLLALGAIRRVPLGSDEAAALHEEHPEWRGQLLMLDGETVHLGPRVFRAVPLTILSVFVDLLRRPFIRKERL
jgi:hypothetical protein